MHLYYALCCTLFCSDLLSRSHFSSSIIAREGLLLKPAVMGDLRQRFMDSLYEDSDDDNPRAKKTRAPPGTFARQMEDLEELEAEDDARLSAVNTPAEHIEPAVNLQTSAETDALSGFEFWSNWDLGVNFCDWPGQSQFYAGPSSAVVDSCELADVGERAAHASASPGAEDIALPRSPCSTIADTQLDDEEEACAESLLSKLVRTTSAEGCYKDGYEVCFAITVVDDVPAPAPAPAPAVEAASSLDVAAIDVESSSSSSSKSSSPSVAYRPAPRLSYKLPSCMVQHLGLTGLERRIADTLMHQRIHYEVQNARTEDAVGHCNKVLLKYIKHYKSFKIGHTFYPRLRWKRFMRDRQWVRLLVFVYVTDICDDSGALEEDLVAHWKKDRRCLNWRDGGGFTTHGVSPSFVYIAF